MRITLANPTPFLMLPLLVACAVDRVDPPVGDAERPSTRARLAGAGAPALPLVPDESGAAIDVRLLRSGGTTERTTLEATSGAAVLRATEDGQLVLEGLEIALEDAVVSRQALPPHGLRLTDLRATLPEPVVFQTRWYGDGDEAWGDAEADVVVDWSLVPSDVDQRDPWPLEPLRLSGVVLDAHVTTDPHGNLVAEVSGSARGSLWSWAGLVELRDAELGLLAMEREDGR